MEQASHQATHHHLVVDLEVGQGQGQDRLAIGAEVAEKIQGGGDTVIGKWGNDWKY